MTEHLDPSILLAMLSAMALPLSGEPALVWLEGPVGAHLETRLLVNCYLAKTTNSRIQIVCLD
jgi:hypothetical protein